MAFSKPLLEAVLETFTVPARVMNGLTEATGKRLQAIKASAKAALETAETTDTKLVSIDVQVCAPIVALMVDPSADKGILLLDPGTLQILGGIGGTSKVNIKFQDMTVRYAKRRADLLGDRSVILNVDDAAVALTLRSRGPAPLVEVDVTLDSALSGQFSPIEFNDTLHVLLNLALTAPSSEGEINEQRGEDEEIEDNGHNQASVDPNDTSFAMSIRSRSLCVGLRTEDGDRLFSLDVDGLAMSMTSRLYDSTIKVGVIAVTVSDRRGGVPGLLIAERNALEFAAEFQMVTISDAHSPISIGEHRPMRKIDIKFGRLSTSLDPRSIVRFKSFYEVFIEAGLRSSSAIASEPQLLVIGPSIPLSLHISADSVSATLLDGGHFSSLPITRASLGFLEVKVDLNSPFMHVDMRVPSVSLSDARPESASWTYKEVLAQSQQEVRPFPTLFNPRPLI